jgi:hypothetical protein
MKPLKCLMFIVVLLVSMVLGCRNSVGPSTEPFVIKIADQAADSAEYCRQMMLPHSDSVSCAETLRYSDTAVVPVFFQDALLLSPMGYLYQKNHIDSTDCNPGGCKYWVVGIQVDTVVRWDDIFMCSFLGQPVAVVKPVKTSVYHIGYPKDTVKITYRDSIITTAGSTRNNLLSVSRSIAKQNFEITASSPPTGITVTRVGVTYFTIAISSDVAPGTYSFEFRVNIDNTFYGSIPCTIKVL